MCALLHVDSVVCLLVRSLLLPLLMDWQVNFSWSFTLETLLASELSELERLLATRQEMLAMMRPLSCVRVARMMGLTGPGAGDSGAGGAVGSHITGSSLAGWSEVDMAATEGTTASPAAGLFKEEEDEDEDEDEGDTGSSGDSPGGRRATPGTVAAAPTTGPRHHPQQQQQQQQPLQCSTSRSCIVGCRDVFAGLDLGMADSSSVNLEVGVVEVANLSPRSGWSQDLTHALLSSASTTGNVRPVSSSVMLTEAVKQADLPLPVVYVFCGSTGGAGDSGFEVSPGAQTPSGPLDSCWYVPRLLLLL
jgi:hypothetical protein